MATIKPNARTVLAGVLTAGLALSSAIAGTPEQDADRQERIEGMYRNYKAVAFRRGSDLSWTEWLSRDDDRVLLDVREPEERAVSTIPGAIDLEAFEADPDAYRGKTIGVYCTIGYRSGVYSRTLEKDGWTSFNLKGGILAWTHEVGEPLTGSDGETTAVHVYGRTWDLAHTSYQSRW